LWDGYILTLRRAPRSFTKLPALDLAEIKVCWMSAIAGRGYGRNKLKGVISEIKVEKA
jgi:hypothetical protein